MRRLIALLKPSADTKGTEEKKEKDAKEKTPRESICVIDVTPPVKSTTLIAATLHNGNTMLFFSDTSDPDRAELFVVRPGGQRQVIKPEIPIVTAVNPLGDLLMLGNPYGRFACFDEELHLAGAAAGKAKELRADFRSTTSISHGGNVYCIAGGEKKDECHLLKFAEEGEVRQIHPQSRILSRF